ncbi:MAG: type II toxin-antitoxin system VapC family toxin [Candidatus Binatia bacterium]
MVAIDTNVLVRFLTGDDEVQYKAGLKLFSSATVFIPDTVVLETEWVLRAAYDLDPTVVCEVLRRVFGLPNVRLANGQRIARAIDWHELGLDFADSLHLASCQDLESLRTFDLDFIRRAAGLGECRVERP